MPVDTVAAQSLAIAVVTLAEPVPATQVQAASAVAWQLEPAADTLAAHVAASPAVVAAASMAVAVVATAVADIGNS